MKIEVEIDEGTALRLRASARRYGFYIPDGQGRDGEEDMPANAAAILAEYAHRPEVVSDRHEAALALVRLHAVELAAQACSGGGRSDADSLARDLERRMLEGGW